jgi:dephospho-CoA kinase
MRALRQNGVYDPNILKAIFLAGGPGSGKSYTAKGLFRIPRGLSQATSGATGLKVVNSDPAFEYFLRKAGIDPSELSSLTPAEFKRVTEGPESPRGKSKVVKKKQRKLWLSGRLGLIIDGTGDSLGKVYRQKMELEELGYDTYMVFVDTTLEVAQERNAARARKLPASLVEKIWSSVQQNRDAYVKLFGPNIVLVDNTVYGPVPGQIVRAVEGWLREPIQNPIGKSWVTSELRRKRRRR